MKITIEREKPSKAWRNPDLKEYHIKSCEPFVRNTKAVLIHRVRTARIIGLGKRDQHLTIKAHCGNCANGDAGKLNFVGEPEQGEIVCQRCEDMAIERGLPSSSELAGRHVHTGGVKAYKNCCKGF